MLCPSLVVSAHDLYLMSDSFQVAPGAEVTLSIHNGDAFPQATSRVFLDRLRNPTLHSSGATPTLPPFALDGVRAISRIKLTTPAHVILTVETVARTESMKGDEFLDYLREENLASVIALREKQGETRKRGARTLHQVRQNDIACRERRRVLQPTSRPSDRIDSRKRSTQFEVRRGLAGSLTLPWETCAWDPSDCLSRGRRQSSDHCTCRSHRQGWPHLNGHRRAKPVETSRAIYMERSADPSADWESFWATLTFESN